MDPFSIGAFLISTAIGIGSDVVGANREKEEKARLKRQEEEMMKGTAVEGLQDPVEKLEAGAKRDEVSQALSMFSVKREVAAPAPTQQTNPLQIPQG